MYSMRKFIMASCLSLPMMISAMASSDLPTSHSDNSSTVFVTEDSRTFGVDTIGSYLYSLPQRDRQVINNNVAILDINPETAYFLHKLNIELNVKYPEKSVFEYTTATAHINFSDERNQPDISNRNHIEYISGYDKTGGVTKILDNDMIVNIDRNGDTYSINGSSASTDFTDKVIDTKVYKEPKNSIKYFKETVTVPKGKIGLVQVPDNHGQMSFLWILP